MMEFIDDAYYEWTQNVFQRKGTMVLGSRIKKIVANAGKLDTGFSTVYAFKPTAAETIIANRASRGMNQFIVGAKEVPIDIDTGEEGLTECEAILAKEGLAYTLYSSGGKGYHVYIPMEEVIWSKDLPYSQLKYLEGIGIKADQTLYQHARLLSLTGRVHKKTGKKKVFVKRVDGKAAKIELVAKPAYKQDYTTKVSPISQFQDVMLKVADLGMNAPREGMRHTTTWSLAKDLLACGLSPDTCFDICWQVNNHWPNPKDDQAVRVSVMQALAQFKKGE